MMKDWLRTYGWKFALALIVAALAIAYIVQLEREANGTARVDPSPVTQVTVA